MNTPLPCPGWIAQLQGDSFDLADWEQYLKPPFDPVCERIPHGDSAIRGLRSSLFDSLQSPEEVRAQAAILVGRLNGAMRAHCGAEPLTLEGVARIDESGNFHFFRFMEGKARGRSRVVAIAEVRDSDGNLVPPPPPAPSEVQKWIQAAERNDDIADMLVFAGRADDWFDLYKAEELSARLSDAPRSNQAKLIRRTANLYRHARPNDPPPVPVPLAEAMTSLSQIIRTLLARLAP